MSFGKRQEVADAHHTTTCCHQAVYIITSTPRYAIMHDIIFYPGFSGFTSISALLNKIGLNTSLISLKNISPLVSGRETAWTK